MKTIIHFWFHLAQFFLEWEMIQTKIKTHVLCSIALFLLCCLWDNVEKYCRAGRAADDSILRCMHIACLVPKPTNAHSQYVILNAFLLQQWLHEFLNVTLYLHCLSFILNILFIYFRRQESHLEILHKQSWKCFQYYLIVLLNYYIWTLFFHQMQLWYMYLRGVRTFFL
jgi:hypothetical protein